MYVPWNSCATASVSPKEPKSSSSCPVFRGARLPREKRFCRFCCTWCSTSSWVVSVWVPVEVGISTCRTALPLGSLIARLMVRCLRFLASFFMILVISWTEASSSLLDARVKRHLRCLSRRDGALCLRSYNALIHETSRASISCLFSSRGLSIFIRLAALRRFRTSGTLPSCHRSIHFRMDLFRSH